VNRHCAALQTVFHALKTMQEQDIHKYQCLRKTFDCVIYEDQILNLALQGKDLRKLVVREVMSKPLPQVPRTAPSSASRKSQHENPRSLWRWATRVRDPDQVRPHEHVAASWTKALSTSLVLNFQQTGNGNSEDSGS